jgi:hypothetical protein
MRSLIAYSALAMLASSPLAAQQATAQSPRPAQGTPTADAPAPRAAAQSGRSERAPLPQGFSVVLVLGDIQAVAATDDVPPAARKALNDMKEFLPFKSYKLLDAAWLMCCGQDPRARTLSSSHPEALSARGSVTQLLRGPDEREYELELTTSRADGSRVFVKFALSGPPAPEIAAADLAMATRSLNRRIADLRDTRAMLDKQLQEARKKVDVGVSSGNDIPKMELEIRRLDRELEEMTTQLAESQAGRATTPRPSTNSGRRNTIIDTSFTMDVGETVVVGTSRLRGGSKALIALLTAVPPRTVGKE